MKKSMWMLPLLSLTLLGCGQFFAPKKQTNPFELDGKYLLTTDPLERQQVGASGKWMAMFKDISMGGSVQGIDLVVVLERVVFNDKCTARPTSVKLSISNMLTQVSDTPPNQAPRISTATPTPATATITAQRQADGTYLFQPLSLKFAFGKDIARILPDGGDNTAFIQAKVLVDDDTFEKCTASLVVKSHEINY